MASRAQWAKVTKVYEGLPANLRSRYDRAIQGKSEEFGENTIEYAKALLGMPNKGIFKNVKSIAISEKKEMGTMAAKKSTKKRGKKTGTAKATASAPKTRAKKRGKKNAGQIPLPILKKRLTKLARIVNERS